MDTRLGDLILDGFFRHVRSRPFSVHGQFRLRGREEPFLYELTGQPAEDLRDKSFEFELPENDREPTEEDRMRAALLVNQQVGPTGKMTLLPSGLHLEWSGQNGPIVIHAPGARLHFLTEEDLKAEAAAFRAEHGLDEIAAADPALAEADAASEDEEETPDDFERSDENGGEFSGGAGESEFRDESEPGGPDDGLIDELKTFDTLLERDQGTPIRKYIADLGLPWPSKNISEEAAAEALRTALARLALYSIAFHICEHCTIRQAYRIFMEEACEETSFMSEMAATSFVHHFTTADFCPTCQAEDAIPNLDEPPPPHP